jgi:hypothetical protein
VALAQVDAIRDFLIQQTLERGKRGCQFTERMLH